MTVIKTKALTYHHNAIFSGHFCYFCNNNCHVISIITYTTVKGFESFAFRRRY